MQLIGESLPFVLAMRSTKCRTEPRNLIKGLLVRPGRGGIPSPTAERGMTACC